MNRKELSVAPIKQGTVIDHIPHGQSRNILRIINLKDEYTPITIGMNLASKKMGLKDLLMISGTLLSEKMFHEVAIFAPNATINLVQDHKVIKKCKAVLPENIERLLVCPNDKCITRHEQIPSYFFVTYHRHNVFLQCKYCEKLFKRNEVRDYVL